VTRPGNRGRPVGGGICGTLWGYCEKRSLEQGKRGLRHLCKQWRSANGDHDHVCRFCEQVRRR
jgi:hypothetical protein